MQGANARALGGDQITDQVRLVRTVFPGFNRAIVGGSTTRPGGFPLGATAIVSGPTTGGKSTLIAGLARSFQMANGIAHYIDAEFALDLAWFHQLGTPLDMYVGKRQDLVKKPPPMYYEDVVREVDRAIETYAEQKTNHPDFGPMLIVVDSLKKLIPKRVARKINREKDIRGAALGREQAGMNTEWVVSLGPKIADHEIAVIFIQHERDGERGGHEIKGGHGIQLDATAILRCEFASRAYDLAKAKSDDGERVVDTRPATSKRHRVTVLKTKVGAQTFGDDSKFCFYVGTGKGLCPVGWDRPRELLEEAAFRGLVGLEWKWGMPLTSGTRFKMGRQSRTLKQLYTQPGLVDELALMLR